MTQQSTRRSIADNLGLREKFQRKYSQQGYLNRYTTTYLIQQVLAIAFIAFLALCSFKFWELLFSGKFGEQFSFWAAIFATSIWIIVTSHLIGKNIEAYFSGDNVNFILVFVCVLFIAGDITFNLKGIPELTAAMMEKPTDAKSPTLSNRYDGQIASIEDKIKEVKAPFYWCPTHRTNHHKKNGEFLTVEVCSDLRFYMGGKATHYVKARKELAALEAELKEVRASYNAESTAAGKVFADELGEYQQKKKLRSEGLKWIQGGVYFLLILLTVWKHQYGARAAESSYSPEPSPASPSPGPGGMEDYYSKVLEELLERVDKVEGQRRPGPTNQTTGGPEMPQEAKIVSLHPNTGKADTAAVSGSTAAVPKVETVYIQDGEGFPIICDTCGGHDVLLQKPRPGHHTFCKTRNPADPEHCRKAFWMEKRKYKRSHDRVKSSS